MKTSTLPSIRVEPALRATVEALLADGETLSEFVEKSVRQAVLRRANQSEFVSRGLLSLERARHTGKYVESDIVLEKLSRKLAAAKSKLHALPQ